MTDGDENESEVAAGVLDALPRAYADEAVSFCLAQVAGLPAQQGAAFVEQLVATWPGSAWVAGAGDWAHDWARAPREALLSAARALPRRRGRVEAFCRLAPWLAGDERREAFEGLLDGTYPSIDWVDGKPFSNHSAHERFLRLAPDEWKEAWVERSVREADSAPAALEETYARDRIGHWPERVVRRLWAAAFRERPAGGERVPLELRSLAPHLPDDLRAEALAVLRACPDARTRRYYLVGFGDEVSDDERLDLVRHPWHERGASCVADHIDSTRRHLQRVPYDEVRAWLREARGLDDDYWRTEALARLVPLLRGADRDEIVAEFVTRARERDDWHGARDVLDATAPADVASLLCRAVDRPPSYFGVVPALVGRLLRCPLAEQTRWLRPAFVGFAGRDPSSRLELAEAASPWLAARSRGAFPAAIARALRERPGLLPAA